MNQIAATIEEMVKGYGPGFPSIEELFGLEPDEIDQAKLESPTPALGRYFEAVKFIRDITSPRAIGVRRFKVIAEYFIALADQLDQYSSSGHRKVVYGLSDNDKATIRSIAGDAANVFRAESIEKFTEHDTAAAGDFMKLKVASELKHLSDRVEGFHFACTSEDIMGNVFGMVANELFYGHLIPQIIGFGNNVLTYVDKHEEKGFLVLPGLTHKQAAEPSTLGKKFVTRLDGIDFLIGQMQSDGRFLPFSGKLGGAIGNLTTHYAAYPDIAWNSFAKRFVESFGLTYNPITDQSVTYALESQYFTTVANMLTHVIKFTNDFIDMASCPGQLFIKTKKKGTKGSSIMPNKSNAWNMEGAVKMLSKARTDLYHLATELPDYPHEGNMGRSYLFRNIGEILMPVFIALGRINRELNQYVPNHDKINAFMNEYPGMSGSVLQTVMKREGIEGDSYRAIESISIVRGGQYANASEFREGLERVMEEQKIDMTVRSELRRLLDPRETAKYADLLARPRAVTLRSNFRTNEYEALKTARKI